MEIRIPQNKLRAALKRELKTAPRSLDLASRAAAERLRAHVSNAIDAKGITDEGTLKNAGKVKRLAEYGRGADGKSGLWGYRNDAPHAAIIDRGARPHSVNAEGMEAIAAWAVRKLGMTEEAATRFAFALRKKLEREGQKPTYVFRDAQPYAAKFLNEEFVRVLRARSKAS